MHFQLQHLFSRKIDTFFFWDITNFVYWSKGESMKLESMETPYEEHETEDSIPDSSSEEDVGNLEKSFIKL